VTVGRGSAVQYKVARRQVNPVLFCLRLTIFTKEGITLQFRQRDSKGKLRGKGRGGARSLQHLGATEQVPGGRELQSRLHYPCLCNAFYRAFTISRSKARLSLHSTK
jgi:hypothetical protein